MATSMARRFILTLLATLTMTLAYAQRHKPPFDPAKFEADLEQFITTEACLTPNEATAFFPLYREMRNKQMVLLNEMKRNRYFDFCSDDECKKAIQSSDERDLEMKRIQQSYHNKFMHVLPASKVFKVIQAEDKFHRNVFKRAAKQDRK